MKQIKIRIEDEIHAKLQEEAQEADRSVNYLVRQILSDHVTPKAPRAPRKAKSRPEGGSYTEAFEWFWGQWRTLKHRCKGEGKGPAFDQWVVLTMKKDETLHQRIAEVLIECAREQDRTKTNEAAGGKDPARFPHLERWLSKRYFEDSSTWERAKSGDMTGAPARKELTSTAGTDGTGEP